MSLLNAIRNEITSGVQDKVSNFVGESRSNTGNAITAIIPAVLAFFADRSQTEAGASSLLNALNDNTFGSVFGNNNYQSVFENNRDSLLSRGNSLMASIFGDRLDPFANEISSYANIGSQSSKGIIAALLPLILNVLRGRMSTSDGYTANSLNQVFEGERESIWSAIPSGLSGLGAALGLSNWGARTSSATGNVHDGTTRTTTTTTTTDRTTVDPTPNNPRRTNWLLPLLGLLAALLLVWFLMRGCNDTDTTRTTTTTQDTITRTTETPVVTDTRPAVRGTYDAQRDAYIYDTGAERTITFDDGTTITVGDASSEARVYDFITDTGRTVSDDKTQDWITLDRVYFNTGENTLTEDSRQQLDNIANIMQRYPNVELKFGGYTDNVGGQEINQPLSDARAKSAMQYVVDQGVATGRMTAEGYGQNHFICEANDTPECKAQNRRVDIRVTRK
ncbi:MAG: OmpA family protein [Weeksellaceae bacterium]|nr:OmpA family protein [Weeksellaceae bacterium]